MFQPNDVSVRTRAQAASRAIVATVGLCMAASSALAVMPQYQVQRVGLTGTVYTNSSGNYSGSITGMTSTGKVFGSTNRFSGATALGRDTWFFDGTTTSQIGYTGGIYEQSNGSRQSTINASNDSGLLGGNSVRYLNGTSTSIGQDAWLFDSAANTTVQLGYTSSQYVLATNNTRSSNISGVAANGTVLGSSNRYSATAQVGSDIWVYNPTTATTTQIGLFGTAYTKADGTRNPIVLGVNMNASGQVVGTASRYTSTGGSLGTDAWLWDGTNNIVLGLSGTQYVQASTGQRISGLNVTGAINNSGQVIGTSTKWNAANLNTGADAWIYTASTNSYATIGLTGGSWESTTGTTAGTRISAVNKINSTGRVAGTSNRYTANGTQIGQDAFFYNGVTSLRIGLTSAAYTAADGTVSSGIFGLTNSNIAYGTTARANSLGTDSWIFNGALTSPTSVVVGLTGVGYEKADGTRTSTITTVNEAGLAIGTSVRYDAAGTSLGNSGWLYDVNLGTTTAILVASFSATGSATTSLKAVSSGGTVVGTYTLYDGAGVSQGNRVFTWNANDGYNDLGALVTNLSAANWDRLVSSSFLSGTDSSGYPLFMTGTGRRVGETADGSLYIISSVPTPGAGALLSLGLLFASKRRR